MIELLKRGKERQERDGINRSKRDRRQGGQSAEIGKQKGVENRRIETEQGDKI